MQVINVSIPVALQENLAVEKQLTEIPAPTESRCEEFFIEILCFLKSGMFSGEWDPGR